MSMRLVVLISGSGSNLQAIIDACEANTLSAKIVGVISNKPGVKGLERAKSHGINHTVVDHTQFSVRETFDATLQRTIDSYEPDLVVLAGFMRILTPSFVHHYLGRIINIHPSLLPKYQGLHTHKRAIEAGDSVHGVTVHFVTAELDGGPAIIQAHVDIRTDDTAETLAAKILVEEHQIYPLAIQWFAERRLKYNHGNSELDGITLPQSGVVKKAERSYFDTDH